jgi:hypothetical protein
MALARLRSSLYPRPERIGSLEEADDLAVLAYAGIPYQVCGDRAGALALMIAWSRSPRARSGSGISAIFASTSRSPSALPRAQAAARFGLQLSGAGLHRGPFPVRESLNFSLLAVALLADSWVSVNAGSSPASRDGDDPSAKEAAAAAASPKLLDRGGGRRPTTPATTRPPPGGTIAGLAIRASMGSSCEICHS